MKCPKCHSIISDNSTVCSHCHKVLALACPNCNTIGQTSTCENCGFIILIKCAKCGKLVPTTTDKCKCGYPVSSSIVSRECESDEFASLVIKFEALKQIRRQLASGELFKKFKIKLKNLLSTQLKNFDGHIIIYGDIFVINYNKELSFQTSANKAVRLALKIINTFTELNNNTIKELSTPLKLTITIYKKKAEDLLKNTSLENNIKLLTSTKQEKTYIKGMQVILDQYIQDVISKDYKTDSLYSLDIDGKNLMFYTINLDNYVIPPEENKIKSAEIVVPKFKNQIVKKNSERETVGTFKVFDISAKCKFERVELNSVKDLLTSNKIIAIRCDNDIELPTSSIIKHCQEKTLTVIRAVCTEDTQYEPWSIFLQLYKDYNKLSANNKLIPDNYNDNKFINIQNLMFDTPVKASSPEDARFLYMEDFGKFLSTIKNCVVLIEGCEYIDDTTIQTLELYFDRYEKLNTNFIFITNMDNPIHRKIKGLLRTNLYTEITLLSSSINTLLSRIPFDVSEFVKSFFFEKIEDNFDGSPLYFDNAIKYLKEKDVLISVEDKLLVRNNSSIILPVDLSGLLKARLKHLSKNIEASMTLAYAALIGPKLDYDMLTTLGFKDVEKNVKILENAGFIYTENNFIYINNYNLIKPVVINALKKEALDFLCKNIIGNLGSGMNIAKIGLLFGKIQKFKEECKFLWNNASIAISSGDYDSYLKNSIGFISLLEYIENDITQQELDNTKNEIYNTILNSLYRYSPEKIYSISGILLLDAIKQNDDEKIKKISNLMLQGALISSNYTDAGKLLHNILTRTENPTLLINGAVNTKFLLLSLVKIEILFNTGIYDECTDSADELLNVITPDIIKKITPPGFSVSLFVEHLMATFRLVGFVKLLRLDNDMEFFFEKIRNAIGEDLPEKRAILTVKSFISGETFAPSATEEESAISKIIYLILKEFSESANDQKTFAQNIYQAKILASEIHQVELELLCDMLIAFAYANIGRTQKAESIYKDIMEKAESTSRFNILCLVRYFIARLHTASGDINGANVIINQALDDILSRKNQAKIFYAMHTGLLIYLAENNNLNSVDINHLKQKLETMFPNNEAKRLI